MNYTLQLRPAPAEKRGKNMMTSAEVMMRRETVMTTTQETLTSYFMLGVVPLLQPGQLV